MTEITTTVTFQDLIDVHTEELDEYRDSYSDIVGLIEEEYGDDAMQMDVGIGEVEDDDLQRLAGLRTTALIYDETAKTIQKRIKFLERMREEYGDAPFEMKMLSGVEVSEIETELRMKANSKDVPVSVLQADKKQRIADAATVGAPEAFPRDDAGSPMPSAAPNPLTQSLHEVANRFTSTGTVDFRPGGFSETTPSGRGTSATPTVSGASSSESVPDAPSSQARGDDS